MAGYALLKAISLLRRNLVGFGDHHKMRPGYPFKPLPEEPPGKVPFIAERTGGINEKDIHIPSHTAVLEGIIRHHQGTSLLHKSLHPFVTIGGEGHRNPPERGREKKGLIPHKIPLPLAIPKHLSIPHRSTVSPADDTR
jgi:hypothetical protein